MDDLIISNSELLNINKKYSPYGYKIYWGIFLPPGIGTVKQSDFGARMKAHPMTQG